MFGFYSHWKVWYKSEKAFGMCSEWHYTTRGLAYGDMTTRPDGLVVMSPSANLPRCVMPFWTHAHAFSLYYVIITSYVHWVDVFVSHSKISQPIRDDRRYTPHRQKPHLAWSWHAFVIFPRSIKPPCTICFAFVFVFIKYLTQNLWITLYVMHTSLISFEGFIGSQRIIRIGPTIDKCFEENRLK